MTARIVTVSAQLGAGGTAMARHVADALGFRYFDWQVTSEAAALAGVSPEVIAASERMPSFMERVLSRLLAASAVTGEESQVMLGPDPSVIATAVQSLGSEDYRRFIEHVVEGLAESGEAVIVGHAGQATLRGRPGVLKVLVHGSPKRRAERMVYEERAATVAEALKNVNDTDRDRLRLFKSAYHVDWLDPAIYDLCLNTDNLPPEQCADLVVAVAKAYP
jgi:cytidylate kinase